MDIQTNLRSNQSKSKSPYSVIEKSGPETAEITTITPDMAKSLLAKNPNNRYVRKKSLKQYIHAMKSGYWLVTNDALAITIEGELINGQHRLMAVVQSNTPQRFLVVRNITPQAFAVMDTGARRNAGDAFKIEKIPYPNESAAVARMIYNFLELGELTSVVQTLKVDNFTLITLIRRYPHISDLAGKGKAIYGRMNPKGLVEGSFINFVLTLYGSVYSDTAQWLEDIATGYDLQTKDPLATFRNMLLAKFRAPDQYKPEARMALLISALNAKAASKKRTKIDVWTPGTPFPQPFGVTPESVKNYLDL